MQPCLAIRLFRLYNMLYRCMHAKSQTPPESHVETPQGWPDSISICFCSCDVVLDEHMNQKLKTCDQCCILGRYRLSISLTKYANHVNMMEGPCRNRSIPIQTYKKLASSKNRNNMPIQIMKKSVQPLALKDQTSVD